MPGLQANSLIISPGETKNMSWTHFLNVIPKENLWTFPLFNKFPLLMKMSTCLIEDHLGCGFLMAFHTFCLTVPIYILFASREDCILLRYHTQLLNESLLRLFLFKKCPIPSLTVEILPHSSKHIPNLDIASFISLSALKSSCIFALSLLQNFKITETYNEP